MCEKRNGVKEILPTFSRSCRDLVLHVFHEMLLNGGMAESNLSSTNMIYTFHFIFLRNLTMESDTDGSNEDFDMCMGLINNDEQPSASAASQDFTLPKGVSLVDDLSNYLLDSDEDSEASAAIQHARDKLEEFSLLGSDSDRSEFDLVDFETGKDEKFDVISVSSNWSDVSRKIKDLEAEMDDDDLGDDSIDEDLDENHYRLDNERSWLADAVEATGEGESSDQSCGSVDKCDEHITRSDDSDIPQRNFVSQDPGAFVEEMRTPRSRLKRQRKKRRLREQVALREMCSDVDEIYNSQTLRDSVDILLTEKHTSKTVPALSHLCIKVVKNLNRSQLKKFGLDWNLPKLMKNIMRDSNVKYSEVKFQESWLSRVLENFERRVDIEKKIDSVLQNQDSYGYKFSEVLCMRNVWNLHPTHWNDQYTYQYSFYRSRPRGFKKRQFGGYRHGRMTFTENDDNHLNCAERSVRSAFLLHTYWMEKSDDEHQRYTPLEDSVDIES